MHRTERKQHLRDLEFLRENVGFQSYSQKDPFQEWTIQSNELFTKLSAKVYRNAAIAFLSLDVDGLVPRPDLAPPTPVVPTEDDAAAAAPADAVRAKLNPADDKPNRAERRAGKKKGGKSRRR